MIEKTENTPLPWALGDVGVAQQHYPTHTLYVVGLPIGNVADMTLRAWWVLKLADVVAAEDTRNTRALLDRLGLQKTLVSVHEHNEREKAQSLISLLQEGQRVAFVTDAGTPAISDPGAKVVHDVQAAGINVMPIPGASASVVALSASGCLKPGFCFVGFVDTGSSARVAQLQKACQSESPVIFYEAPHRLAAFLEALSSVLEPTRRVVIHRELTKRFETITPLEAGALPAFVRTHSPKGEYVIVVEGAEPQAQSLDATTQKWLSLIKEAMPASKAAQLAAKATGLPRQALYQYLTQGTWPHEGD